MGIVSALRSAGFVLELPLLPRPPKPRQAQLLRHLDQLLKTLKSPDITSFLGLLMDLYKCFQNGHFVTKFIEMSIGRFSDQGECIAEGLLDRVAIAFPDLGHCLDKCRAWIAWIRCMTEDTGPIFVPIWDENVPCTYIPPPMPFDTGGVGRAGSSCQCSILQ